MSKHRSQPLVPVGDDGSPDSRSAEEPYPADSTDLLELVAWHTKDSRSPLLKLTLDQLRTFLLLDRFRLPGRVARETRRDQSIVQSQLNALNSCFAEITREDVATSQGRGKPHIITGTGKELATWSARLFRDLDGFVTRLAQMTGRQLDVGATAFTVPLVGHVIHELRQESDVEVNVKQIRTKEWWNALRGGVVKLVLAAVPAPNGTPEIPDDLEFLPSGPPDPAALLTSLTPAELPGKAIDEDRLLDLDLILPEAGIIVDLLERIYGRRMAKLKRCEPTISDIYYGINVLQYGLTHASMVVLRSAGEWATKGATPAYANAPPRVPPRLIELNGAFAKMPVCAGLFAKADDLKQFGDSHPVTIFWRLFEKNVVNHGQRKGKK